MAGNEWPFTMLGRQFFDNQLPSLIKNVGRVADELKRYNDRCQARDVLSEASMRRFSESLAEHAEVKRVDERCELDAEARLEARLDTLVSAYLEDSGDPGLAADALRATADEVFSHE